MVYPVDDTQGQGFAVESTQDSNFRSGIQMFGQCTPDQKLTLIYFHISDQQQQPTKLASILEHKLFQNWSNQKVSTYESCSPKFIFILKTESQT